MYFKISKNNIKIKYYFTDQVYLDYYDNFGLDDFQIIKNENTNNLVAYLGRQVMQVNLVN